MTTQEMFDALKSRTKISDASKLGTELRSAYRWVVRRVYNAAGGPDLLMTIGEELPALVAVTRDYDLGANVTAGELLGIKKLWLKLPQDTRFTGMDPSDADDPGFANMDSGTNATPDVAGGHPVLYTVINFDKLRFAPALPTTSVLRADYFRIGPVPDPTTNDIQQNSLDLPAAFHDAMVSKATAQLFTMLDDTREGTWETRARDELNDAIFTATNRTQYPTTTQPYKARRRRYI